MPIRKKSGARWNHKRDGKLLYALGRAVLLTVSQIQKIGPFGSREAAARRMRKLSLMGYVRILRLKDKTQPYHYGLTETGKNWLLDNEDLLAEKIHVPRNIRRRDLEHLGQLADIRIQLGQVCDLRDDVLLAEFLGEADLRRLCPRSQTVWIPDAFFILETTALPMRHLGFWLELDRGTDSAKRLVQSKLLPLARYAQEKQPFLNVTAWTILALMERESRASAIRRNLAGIPSRTIYFSLLSHFLANPLAPLWRQAPLAARFQPAQAWTLMDILFQQGVPAAGTGW